MRRTDDFGARKVSCQRVDFDFYIGGNGTVTFLTLMVMRWRAAVIIRLKLPLPHCSMVPHLCDDIKYLFFEFCRVMNSRHTFLWVACQFLTCMRSPQKKVCSFGDAALSNHQTIAVPFAFDENNFISFLRSISSRLDYCGSFINKV
jgi:hypothetical protein